MTVAPAARSDKSDEGTHGGVFMAVAKHVESSPKEGAYVSKVQDLTAASIHLRDMSFLVIGDYTRGGGILLHMRAEGEVARKGRRPFICVADFNINAAVFSSDSWMSVNGSSCFQGRRWPSL